MAESKEEIKSLLIRRGDAKSGLKLNIQKTIHKIILNIHGIQSHNSWHIDEEKCKQWQILFSLLQNHYGPWLQPQNQKTFDPWEEAQLWKTWTV